MPTTSRFVVHIFLLRIKQYSRLPLNKLFYEIFKKIKKKEFYEYLRRGKVATIYYIQKDNNWRCQYGNK